MKTYQFQLCLLVNAGKRLRFGRHCIDKKLCFGIIGTGFSFGFHGKQSHHPIKLPDELLDMDLAELYSVETKQLKRAVRRNIERFPEDFMYELTLNEFEHLRCQFGTSSWESIRYAPMGFTEHEVIMLARVFIVFHYEVLTLYFKSGFI